MGAEDDELRDHVYLSTCIYIYIHICACIMVKKHVLMIINKCSKVGDGEQN